MSSRSMSSRSKSSRSTSSRTIIAAAAALVLGVASLSTDALAFRGGARGVGHVGHYGNRGRYGYHGGYAYRRGYWRPGVGVGLQRSAPPPSVRRPQAPTTTVQRAGITQIRLATERSNKTASLTFGLWPRSSARGHFFGAQDRLAEGWR